MHGGCLDRLGNGAAISASPGQPTDKILVLITVQDVYLEFLPISRVSFRSDRGDLSFFLDRFPDLSHSWLDGRGAAGADGRASRNCSRLDMFAGYCPSLREPFHRDAQDIQLGASWRISNLAVSTSSTINDGAPIRVVAREW